MKNCLEGPAIETQLFLILTIMKCYTYILRCANDSYYTGSTKDLEQRMDDHSNGRGANHTAKYPPIKLVYLEEFTRIDHAFNREKQIQKWSSAKKEALINGELNQLKDLAKSYRFK